MALPFKKPATSIAEQIELLQKRGLVTADPKLAAHYLLHVGYYRLAGYWQIFQEDRINHKFFKGTRIEQIVDLYNFDRELRLLLIDAIERIEVSFRSVLADVMCCSYDPAWYADDQYAFNTETFDDIMDIIDKELDRSSEEFIKHHDEKYGKEEYPPAWKTFQVLSFGTLSRIYGNIRNGIPERKLVANKYGLPAAAWLHSWMQVVSVLRNYCAHHSRVCYRTFAFPPKEMNKPLLPWIKKIPVEGDQQHQSLYYQLCAIKYLLHTCSPENHFHQKLQQLMDRYPSIDITRMGFMDGWQKEHLWK